MTTATSEGRGVPNRTRARLAAVPDVRRTMYLRSLSRVADLSRDEVTGLFALTDRLRFGERPAAPLASRIVCTLFFEPSTRTRLSFESAALRLGASILSVPDGRVTAADKGESLGDIGRMLDSYADLVVLRHPSAQALAEFREVGATVPMINGGDGQREHPTQALSDWYTLSRSCTFAKPLHIGVIGIPAQMRTLRSFLLMGLRNFAHAIGQITVYSPSEEPLDQEIADLAEDVRVPIRCSSDLAGTEHDLDVIYLNSLTNFNGRYEFVNTDFTLSRANKLKPECLVMHPLARGAELDRSLDATRHNLYFRQSENAVFIRQALLTAILGGPDHGYAA